MADVFGDNFIHLVRLGFKIDAKQFILCNMGYREEMRSIQSAGIRIPKYKPG